MGKKRRAISAPQKHKVRARILGVNNTTTTSNSEANEDEMYNNYVEYGRKLEKIIEHIIN